MTSKFVPYFWTPKEKLETLFQKTVSYKNENTKKEIIWVYEVSYITQVILLAAKSNKIKL
jgi:hypothetical protein